MKKTLGMDSIFRQEKVQCCKNIKCIIIKSPILEFSQTYGLHRIIKDNIIHHLKVIPANINDSILIKVQNTSFGTIIGHFGPNFIQNWPKMQKF